MKKFLLFALCVLMGVGTSLADETTIVFRDVIANNYSTADRTWTIDEKKLPLEYQGFEFRILKSDATKDPTWNKNQYLVLSAGTTFSIKAPNDGTISRIELVCSAGYASGAKVGDTDCTIEGNSMVWSGAPANEITLIGLNADSRMTSVKLTYSAELPTSDLPVFTPEAGTYTNSVTVSISAAEGAEIHYIVVDPEKIGSEIKMPTVNDPVYSEPITLTRSQTVKALAVEPGKDPSPVATAVYTIVDGVVCNNIAQFVGMNHDYTLLGTDKSILYQFIGRYTVVYQNGPVIYIQDSTGGLRLDGATGQTYEEGDIINGFSGYFSVADKGGLPAIAIEASTMKPAVSHADYVWTEGTSADMTKADGNRAYELKDVYFSRDADAESSEFFGNARFVNGQSVVIYNVFSSLSTFDYAVALPEQPGYYTIKGFVSYYTEDKTSQIQFLPISFVHSKITDAAAPVITPAAGTYKDQVEVTVTAAEGTKVYYTVDGTVPSAEATEYTAPFTLTESATVKAIAFEEGKNPSVIVEVVYVIEATPVTEAPVITPEAGEYEESVEVTVTATEGAKIYYTVDGTEPTAESTEYTAPFTLTESATVKAVAIEEGKKASEVAEAAYVITEKSGIETIEASDADTDAVYYDLQGRRVAAKALNAGIYLRRLGNTVEKIAVK